MQLLNSFIQSLVDLPRQEGSVLHVDETYATPENVSLEMIGVPEGSPMVASLDITSVSEGVYVTGTVGVDVVGLCGRCLVDINEHREEEISELIFYPERKIALLEEGDDVKDYPEIVKDSIDLEPLFRDAIVLNLPFRPLCTPNCRGLCSECGERWEDLPEDHSHELPAIKSDALDALEAVLRAEEGK
ncbi:YceD family protein [Actinotignum urinale]|uniref:YceD family protein n=1 Tax=Actinotignum urinale TaxID=190146 RepID=A0AAW9HNH1_9ACTO|nr:YceD family protein [Actinotignum urinale]MDY5129611.1 YceD family protein [Actinotignum urinale]MDY5151821.1 YceD family protein [Actinotignum urinale]MDY5155317.1 YceD family protein [Actinotignum urinale]MDY5160016.1 YceD family protein [Actinotignum urinale]